MWINIPNEHVILETAPKSDTSQPEYFNIEQLTTTLNHSCIKQNINLTYYNETGSSIGFNKDLPQQTPITLGKLLSL